VRLERCLEEVSHWMSTNRLKLNADKTELLWAGSKYCTANRRWAARACRYRLTHCHSVRPRSLSALPSRPTSAWTNMFPACEHHVSFGFANFEELNDHWKMSPRRHVHAFVTAQVDYCNVVFSSSPRSVTDKLQWVLNAAARLVSGTHKYDRGMSQISHADLHWLDVADRVWYKLGVTVHRCLHNKAPQYLVDCCVPVSDIASHQRLRSARLTADCITPST